ISCSDSDYADAVEDVPEIKRRLVAYATAALSVQTSLDFVGQRELELVGALLRAVQERIGIASALSYPPERIDPEQNAARIAVSVGRNQGTHPVVDIPRPDVGRDQLAVEYPVDRR